MKKIITLSLSLVFSLSIYGQNLLTLITYENWSGGTWVNYSEQTNTYDGSGYLTNQLDQLWDGSSSSWNNNEQFSYTNNGNGTVQQNIKQSWNPSSGTWMNSERLSYTHNGSNQVLTLTYENWSGGAWVNYVKSTNSYDGSGYLTNNVFQLWDSSSSSWKNSSQTNYTNNVNGTTQQLIQQSWLPTGAWSNSIRTIYTYNGSNQVLAMTTEFWSGGAWINYLKSTNSYDASGYLTNNLVQLWDSSSSSWENSNQTNYTNNVNGTTQQLIQQSWLPTGAWSNSQRATFTYTNSTGIHESNEIPFHFFPNPTSGILNIALTSLSEYEVFNINGQRVAQGKTEGQIDITNLPTGSYQIIITNDDGRSTQTIQKI